MNFTHKPGSTLALLAVILSTAHAVGFAADEKNAGLDNVPDLTKELPAEMKNVHNLGPTGMQGWIFVEKRKLVPQDIEPSPSTERARQIYVAAVEKGSPADGVLAVGDVILGIGEKPFSTDPRVALGNAINEAEQEENKGVLRLLRWRPTEAEPEGASKRPTGSREAVSLQLKILGTYSKTAPYNCAKSAAVLQQTLDAMVKQGVPGKLDLACLALLATGEEQYLEQAKAHILKEAKPDFKLGPDAIETGSSWNWGYHTVLLCEYYLMTGDKSILPAIREYTVAMARGQSIAGNWGHRMATPSFNDGRLHGRLTGYAALNQPSLTCFMAMVMAQKCGVEHPELTAALEKSNYYFRYYADKGAIPYGYHSPMEYLQSNNGTSGSAAIAFAIKGDLNAARFFSLLCVGAHVKLEMGHTGTYFNTMWTGLGANLAGPEVYTDFFKHWTWLRTLARKWDGGFVYQHPGGGSWGYRGLSPDAAMVLHYCLPRRALLITGREQDQSLWLKDKAARDAVAVWEIDYHAKSPAELRNLLGHEVPLVRRQAATELATREGESVQRLQRLLKGTRNQKIGACHALAEMKESAAPALNDLMELAANDKEEFWVRSRALRAISSAGEPAQRLVPDLLKMIVVERTEDRRRDFEVSLGAAVVALMKEPFDKAPHKEWVYAAAKRLLDHPHHSGRYYAMTLIGDLPLEDFHLFADQVVKVILNNDPQYTVYHSDRARQLGLALLDRLNIEEGIELCIQTIEPNLWGQKYRIAGKRGRLSQLQAYGVAAKPYIPKIKTVMGEKAAAIVEEIEASTATRDLITLEQAKRAGKEP